MKKIIPALLAVIIVIFSNLSVLAIESPFPQIESEAAVLMDAQTGQVLFEKNMHKQLPPASITKIMTVLLGLENADLNDTVTMSRYAVFSIEKGSSHIALDTDEQITMEQALMAAMLPSANDASNGIAEHVSGTIPDFAKLMNKRAVEAGALHTNFVNSNGLFDDNHITTAYDMAMITKTALLNEQFRRIFATSRYEIPPTNKQPKIRYLWAEHKMFKGGRYEYDGVIGGKTGYTQKSQNTLVTVARRGDRELITVVLKSNGAVYADTKALLDYGFDQFNQVGINLPGITAASLINTEDNQPAVLRLLHKSINVNDIVIDKIPIGPAGSENDQLQINLRLQNPSNLMYGDLGSIILNNPPPPTKSWLTTAVNILIVILKVIAGFIVFLFGLRWFFTIRRKLRRKLSYGWKK